MPKRLALKTVYAYSILVNPSPQHSPRPPQPPPPGGTALAQLTLFDDDDGPDEAGAPDAVPDAASLHLEADADLDADTHANANANANANAETDLAPALHPAVWRAHQLGRAPAAVQPSGFEALDAELPGGGWPHGALTELLLPHPGLGELRLLAPALARLQAAGRVLLWFDPPAAPCAQALQWLGLQLPRLVLVRRRDGLGPRHPAGLRERLPAADTLWALEQALHSGHAGAVLAWLPARLPADVLRRLQLAAQAHDGPAFVLRDAALAVQPSPAPLRLALSADGPDRLRLRLLKRRGPPVPAPLVLDLPPVLPASVAARWPVPSPAIAPARPAARPGLPAWSAAAETTSVRSAGSGLASPGG
jgi:protein ImuA